MKAGGSKFMSNANDDFIQKVLSEKYEEGKKLQADFAKGVGEMYGKVPEPRPSFNSWGSPFTTPIPTYADGVIEKTLTVSEWRALSKYINIYQLKSASENEVHNIIDIWNKLIQADAFNKNEEEK
jgi:hypothetical protein